MQEELYRQNHLWPQGKQKNDKNDFQINNLLLKTLSCTNPQRPIKPCYSCNILK